MRVVVVARLAHEIGQVCLVEDQPVGVSRRRAVGRSAVAPPGMLTAADRWSVLHVVVGEVAGERLGHPIDVAVGVQRAVDRSDSRHLVRALRVAGRDRSQ